MKPFFVVSSLSLLLALSACANFSDIAAPQSQLADVETLSGSHVLPLDWPQGDWWQQWHDPQLNALLSQALQDNPQLQSAAARLRQAQAQADVHAAAQAPQVRADVKLTRERYSENDFIPPPEAGNFAWYNEAALKASYDLDLWGKQSEVLRAALSEAQMVAAEQRLATLNLQTAIIRSYIQLALEYRQLDLVTEQLAQQQQLLKISRQRQQAGLAAEAEVVQWLGRLPASHGQLEQHQERITVLRNQLAVLSGQPPRAGQALQRPQVKLDSLPVKPAQLPAQLLGYRPDLIAQRWRVEAEGAKIKVAKAAFYPNINLTAFAGFTSIGFADFLSAATATRGIAPAISLPVFEGGRLRSQLRVQTASYDQAVDSYNATLLKALRDTADAITRLQSANQQCAFAQQSQQATQREFSLAQQAFRAGLSDQGAVLQARLLQLGAQQRLLQSYGQNLDSFVSLMAELGGGIQVPGEAQLSAGAQP
ncbi:efflux transporter outer membrane subunit [Neisseriaceae bacterium TC5R-5]|nr:efflux transporter outer membrane subunit [Neisseriaceae bacterium TC5R-5]